MVSWKMSAGIAARNLQECLLIQARMLGIKNKIIEVIIKDYLKDLELKNYVHIAHKLKVPLRDVEIAVLLISRMNPKPGSMYSEDKIQPIIPDVYIVKAGDEYKIILNDDGLPRLRISNFYREIMAGLTDHGHGEEENGKKYIKDKVQSATWLIKAYSSGRIQFIKWLKALLNSKEISLIAVLISLNH